MTTCRPAFQSDEASTNHPTPDPRPPPVHLAV
jgi:hypothetical protein